MSNSIADILRHTKLPSESPRLDLELLLMHVTGRSRAKLIAEPKYVLTSEQFDELQSLITKREQGMPIAYMIGSKDFWSLTLSVNKDVLIPRAETELLVEKTLERLPQTQCCTVADLGTGSGAIALAIASERPHWHIIATDKSEAALQVAHNNANRLNINNVEFLHGDWCDALPTMSFQAIIANPPYISKNDPDLEAAVENFEPAAALFAEQNGQADIIKIITQSKALLDQDGFIILEHGAYQAKMVESCLLNKGFYDIETFQDLANLDRATAARAKIERSA